MKSSPKSYNFFSIKEFAMVIAIVAVFFAVIVPSFYFIRSSTRSKKIEEQLAAISKAGRYYIDQNGGTSVSYKKLVSEGYIIKNASNLHGESYKKLLSEGKIKEPTKFYGESYEGLVVYSAGGFLAVTMENGDEIKVKY